MSDQNVCVHLIAGGLAGTTGAILTCPLEVVKTRLQACQNALSNKPHKMIQSNNHLNSSPIKLPSYSNILLRNSHPQVYSNSFFVNELKFHTHISNSKFFLQDSRNSLRLGKNILQNFKSIIQNEGFKALFKGLGPNIVGVAPYRAIYFFSYANSKSYLSKKLGEERPVLHMLAAFMAGFTSVTITNPIWFIKTRLQLDQSRQGQTAISVMRKILREKGPLGFYKGISASYFGIAESALYFVLYERLKKLSDCKEDKLSIGNCLTSAGFSKTLASILCYPHEVARTRLRQEGTKYTGFFQTINLIFYQEGINGLYKGMATHLIRQIPNTVVVMTTYELLISYFKENSSYLDGK